jgi:hypothetical protein
MYRYTCIVTVQTRHRIYGHLQAQRRVLGELDRNILSITSREERSLKRLRLTEDQ